MKLKKKQWKSSPPIRYLKCKGETRSYSLWSCYQEILSIQTVPPCRDYFQEIFELHFEDFFISLVSIITWKNNITNSLHHTLHPRKYSHIEWNIEKRTPTQDHREEWKIFIEISSTSNMGAVPASRSRGRSMSWAASLGRSRSQGLGDVSAVPHRLSIDRFSPP